MKQRFLAAILLFLAGMIGTQAFADIISLTKNTESGIDQANYTGTLPDGTILGYYKYGYNEYIFCGAISECSHIVVPDSVLVAGSRLAVLHIGFSGLGNLDLSKSTSTNELTFGESLRYIYSSIPSSIENIHLKSATPPDVLRSEYLPASVCFWVPESAYSSYIELTQNSKSIWYNRLIRSENWTPNKVNVKLNSAGSLANEILKVVDQWSYVDELTVTGPLNREDMKYFSRMSNLYTLDLSGTDIAFIGGCKDLKYLSKVILPETVKVLEDEAFSSCIRLKVFDFSNVIKIGNSGFSNCQLLGKVEAPNLMEMGSFCFSGCGNLSSVSIPKVKEILPYTFRDCSALSSFDFSNVEYLGTDAFNNCRKLETVNAPNLKTLDGKYIFRDCRLLKEAKLGDKVTKLPAYLFYFCMSLTNFDIPKSVKTIEERAFVNCPLNEMVFPEGVTYIQNSLFSYNNESSIKKISLPSTIEGIAYNAFEGCNSVEEFQCHAVVPLPATGFSNYNGTEDMNVSGINLYVPKFSVSSYKLDEKWFKFGKILPIEGDIENLDIKGDFSIYDLDGLAYKVDLAISNSGHLTVSAGSTMSLGNYRQNLNFQIKSDYVRDENGKYGYVYSYPYCSTLVTNSEIRADKVTQKVAVQKNRWTFISFPYDVEVSGIGVPEGTMWVVRKYNGANRAAMSGDTWENVTAGQMLNAGEGYILHCVNETSDSDYLEFEFSAVNNSNKNNIFAHTDVAKKLNEYPAEFSHNRGWNLVGNPYPSYYSINDIDFPAPITVWNGNGYTAYSLADDSYTLRPNEAFFIQCPLKTNEIKFGKDGKTHTYSQPSSESGTRADGGTSENRSILNFILSNEEHSDRARIVVNEKAAYDYEIERDASKFMSTDEVVPQIYIADNGVNYAIDERPLGTGVYILGVKTGKEGSYKIALNAKNSEYEVVLVDNETKTETNLNAGEYSFDAGVQTSNNRFVVKINNIDSSSIDNLKTDSLGFSIRNNRLYVEPRNEISVYSVDGKTVYSGIAEGYVDLSKGIYILSINKSTYKITII